MLPPRCQKHFSGLPLLSFLIPARHRQENGETWGPGGQRQGSSACLLLLRAPGSGGSLELLSEGSEPVPGEISRQLCPRRCPEEGWGLTQKKRVRPGSREGGHAQWALSALRRVRGLPWAWAAKGGGVRWEVRKEQDSCCSWGRSPTPVSFPTTGSLLSK